MNKQPNGNKVQIIITEGRVWRARATLAETVLLQRQITTLKRENMFSFLLLFIMKVREESRENAGQYSTTQAFLHTPHVHHHTPPPSKEATLY